MSTFILHIEILITAYFALKGKNRYLTAVASLLHTAVQPYTFNLTGVTPLTLSPLTVSFQLPLPTHLTLICSATGGQQQPPTIKRYVVDFAFVNLYSRSIQ